MYTDGACWNNGKANAKCRSGIWFSPNHRRNAAIRVPGPKQSNQVGELAAVIEAVSSVPNFYPLTIITDSRYVIDGLTEHLGKWEDNGWIGIDNAEFFKRAANLPKKRTAETTFQWVRGHRGILGNEESDKLAKEGANKDEADSLPLYIPKEYDLQGAKLSTLTQATAYKGIQSSATPRHASVATVRSGPVRRHFLRTPNPNPVRFGPSGRTANLIGVRCGSGAVRGIFQVWTRTEPEPSIIGNLAYVINLNSHSYPLCTAESVANAFVVELKKINVLCSVATILQGYLNN